MTDVATLTPKLKIGRHSWGEPVRFEFKTERTCIVCGITKVTRHEPGQLPWLEFFRGMDRVCTENNRTPVCEGAS